MGYYIKLKAQKFSIKKENFDAALKAIQSLANNKETITDSSGRHFSWVRQGFEELDTLPAILDEWRYIAKIDTEGIYRLEFTGEKYGDDDLLFKTLAPYVEAGSYLEWLGEDGDKWRFTFDGKVMKQTRPKIVWE